MLWLGMLKSLVNIVNELYGNVDHEMSCSFRITTSSCSLGVKLPWNETGSLARGIVP